MPEVKVHQSLLGDLSLRFSSPSTQAWEQSAGGRVLCGTLLARCPGPVGAHPGMLAERTEPAMKSGQVHMG